MHRILPLLLLLAGCRSREDDAYAACQHAIAPHLAAPGSARYPALPSDSLTMTREGEALTFEGSLDSQNRFGALLRTSFYCKALRDGDTWRIVGLRLGDRYLTGF